MLLNHPNGYGALTKSFHWLVVALFAFQLGSALVMTRLGPGPSADGWYNWHKTLGLVALLVAVARLWVRRAGTLPAWAPCLTETDKRVVHHAERLLYLGMFLMPLSGFVLVMAGGYGVLLAGRWALPNPLPRWDALAIAASWLHLATGIMIAAALAGHLWVVLRHRGRLLPRMLPNAPRPPDAANPG
jgi:cytochrome b561